MTIDGETVSADEYTNIRNPANTEEIVGQAPVGNKTHLDKAIAAAEKAYASWRFSSDEDRVNACNAIAKVCSDNAEELAVLLTKEQGKPLGGLGSNFELGGCAGWAGYTATLALPDKVIEDSDERHVVQKRVPLGVVGSITPWNWPLMIAIWHIVPGIRSGNTVVIKPSPYTPLSTLRMVELMNEVLPAGLVNVISGGDELGAELTGHDGVNKIVFTGSIATGKKVMASAAKSVTPVTLELGGNDAGIMLQGEDPAKFAEGMFFGSMINSGQTCGAMKRLYVHEDDLNATVDALVGFAGNIPMGDGMDESSLLGPVQNERQFKRVVELVEDAKANGGTCVLGGEPAGGPNYFYPVTIVTGVSDGVRLVDEEQFGPVLPIITYTDLEDAISAANGLEFGLDASVWGSDAEATAAVAERLEAGTVLINKHGEIAPHIPFGGIKCSGLGVEFGEEGLAAYTSIKIINSAA
ncbi:MAG: aldehyde dehydrogenase family protein [Woeseia sp.]|nr:aldehyde dehydrogenase family protein [Woeseia sp.]MBT6210347.1 aldehyde dehydrogenase family protein [Woeseia sp.]